MYVRKEIETHMRLRHACVVRMMRFFEDGDEILRVLCWDIWGSLYHAFDIDVVADRSIYMVMELCEGAAPLSFFASKLIVIACAGGSLSGFLQQQEGGVLDESSVRSVMRRLISGTSLIPLMPLCGAAPSYPFTLLTLNPASYPPNFNLPGVSYLHSHSVAHRDIKPSNVLIDINGHGS